MSVLATLRHGIMAAYRLVIALWNASVVLFQVVRSVMQEAQQEAAEAMALLDDGANVMDAITATSLLEASGPTSPWHTPMLIIARASSFALLLRLSARRVLHLEVDERFIASRLEVIRTGLTLNVQHVPRLLQIPIGTHDAQLVRYTPLKFPCVWKEERCAEEVAPAVPAAVAAAAPVKTGSEGRSRRKRCVQLLTESALRRRSHMDRVGRAGSEGRRGTGVAKTQGDSVGRRKALTNATNAWNMQGEGGADAEGASDATVGSETSVADTPKQVRMERNIHAALSENLSIPSMAQATASRKAVKSVSRLRRSDSQPLRRKQFDLYAQGASSEFSLLSMTGQ